MLPMVFGCCPWWAVREPPLRLWLRGRGFLVLVGVGELRQDGVVVARVWGVFGFILEDVVGDDAEAGGGIS